jgi:uncharacterized protein with NAD-binding domain and iron-sulfur cluster
MASTAKQKIAILGGGVGAMTAAWQITSEPGWQDKYEVTVYQMGWRLGGKGASGRRAPHWRIEEHGLHIWLGFYHNAFRMLQAAFAEINPEAAAAPVGNTPPRMAKGVFLRCEDAFLPHSYVGAYQQENGRAVPWMVEMPRNDELPWQGGALPSLWSYLVELAQLLLKQAGQDWHAKVYKHEDLHQHQGLMGWLKEKADDLALDAVELGEGAGLAALSGLASLMAKLPHDTDLHLPGQHALLKLLLRQLQAWVAHEFQRLTADDLEGRRHLLMTDFVASALRGVLEDRILEGRRLGELDEEVRTWLTRHGAMPVTVDFNANPLLRVFYDFVFAFLGGDSDDPAKTANFATAPTLRTLFRMCCTYNGAIFWKMRAGMGDTIFTPLYKALMKRGVQFKFFHKVQKLALSEDGRAVQRIHMARQVNTLRPYEPLVNVKGLDCWPSLALYQQIEQGDRLQVEVERQKLDLESLWFDWPNAEEFALEKGRDFDTVVFGISLGSVPLLCDELCQANPAWRRMVDTVQTVATTGVQLWLRPSLPEFGWAAAPPILDGFHEPLDTWADMSHLLPVEDWDDQDPPHNIAYFCGALKAGPLDPEDAATPKRAAGEVARATRNLLDTQLGWLWPKAVDGTGALKEGWLLDRYQRANVDPSERYVLSVAHSESARLKANASGFDNLVLTGDWIDNGFNAGCVEASAMAGLQAGNSVLGKDLYDGVIGQELC